MTANKNIHIASVLQNKKSQIAEVFAHSLYLSPRWKDTLDAGKHNWPVFLEEEFFAYVDYLSRYFESGNAVYKNLFLGEKLKSLYDADLDSKDRNELAGKVQAYEKDALEALLKTDLGDSWEAFISELKDVNLTISTQATSVLNIVFVGDCLFLDILPFIVGPLLKEGISIHTHYVASKNPAEAREALKNLSTEKISLIFYSPFTYDFSPNLAVTQQMQNAFMSESELIASIAPSWAETEKTIDLIAAIFDCPIFVHNTALIIRDENTLKRNFKLRFTSRIRSIAKKWIHEKLSTCLETINTKTYRHLFLFDESEQLKATSELNAGALLYNSKLQHPSVLGMVFANPYVDIIQSFAKLYKKKLVVCDLDNTLWDGVIGEGAVKNFHDRQAVLKKLREKGVVLAINSKNDPKNVHWTNATLTEKDFVYEAINWQPKVQNMARIPDELNLKINSFVFIDDRADELEMMREAYPDVLCLNATDPKTWERLAIWAHILEDDTEMDRTLMYQQREKRKEFVKEDVTSDADRYAMFASLGLQLHIKRPDSNEIKRVTELVNRTNQFNLEGVRISLIDMNQWVNDKDYIILSGRTLDRFGDMGVTCVTVGKLVGDEFRIIAFVLSCRVFGYYFEHSVMNYLKKLLKEKGVKTIKAKYIATPVNAPCKSFLQDNGFVTDGEFSYFDLNNPPQPDAAWINLKIES